MNNGGADLSAGQRQLIALARAQLANAHILLLDEATSRLDRASEERLMSSLTDVAHTGKHLALIVAHRSTTAQRFDLIAVIDKGAACGIRHPRTAGSGRRPLHPLVA